MRERLYLAGYPTTPRGWLGFTMVMALGIAATLINVGLPGWVLLSLILASWLINLAVVQWPWQPRLISHLATWVIIWRASLPGQPWYQAIPVTLLLAGAVVWEQERRKKEWGPA